MNKKAFDRGSASICPKVLDTRLMTGELIASHLFNEIAIRPAAIGNRNSNARLMTDDHSRHGSAGIAVGRLRSYFNCRQGVPWTAFDNKPMTYYPVRAAATESAEGNCIPGHRHRSHYRNILA
jgi:hypothetical protein